MNVIKPAFLSLVLSAAVSTAQADNYEGYTSLVEGVGLWWLESAESNVSRRMTLGENPDFAAYCDGKNKIYIYEENSRAAACGTDYVQLWDGASQSVKAYGRWDGKTLQRTLKKAKSRKNSEFYYEYAVSMPDLRVERSGIYTVSKTKLLRGDWKITTPSTEERDASIALAKRHLLAIPRDRGGYEYRLVLGARDEEIDKMMIERKGGWTNAWPPVSHTTKIETKDVRIILIPTLYQSSSHDGDLFSSVVLERQGSYSFLGHVQGCLLSVGADIDRDGIPEIVMESCDMYEGHSIHYYKIFPQTKPLITYKHF